MTEETTNPEETEIIATQQYTITVKLHADGTSSMTRTNEGFTPLELMGLADFIALEIREQIMGRILPDVIKRQVKV